MPKRKREETKEERWSRKLKKYEAKLQEKQRRNSQRIIYSSDEDDVQHEEHLAPGTTSFGDVDVLCDDSAVPVPTIDECGLSSNDEVTAVEATTDDFDEEVLRVLDVEPEVVEYSDDIHTDIAVRFQQILVNGLRKETREELMNKYLFPKNVPFLKAPILNPEIEAMLAETCRLRDKRLLNKQNQLGRALSGLGKAMSSLVKKSPHIPEVVRTLNDVGKLIADSHYAETDTRRSIIIPLVGKPLTGPFKNRKRDVFLFGDGLGEVVKNFRGIKRTSQLIQAATPTPNTNNLNYRGPSTQSRQQWVGHNYPQQRAGGQRATYQNRGRGAPFPPPPLPPPARRQTGPPPPPPRRQPAQRPRVFRSTDRQQK